METGRGHFSTLSCSREDGEHAQKSSSLLLLSFFTICLKEKEQKDERLSVEDPRKQRKRVKGERSKASTPMKESMPLWVAVKDMVKLWKI